MLLIQHRHEPLYRVIRAGWADALDWSFSVGARTNRWNPPASFPALYVSCSELVARAITLDLLGMAGLVLDDLQAEVRPQLVEISWAGDVVDMASGEGISAAGLPLSYSEGIGFGVTQPLAEEWHDDGAEGVLGRSASVARMGFTAWTGDHRRWSELAIFPENASRRPKLVRRRDDLSWYYLPRIEPQSN